MSEPGLVALILANCVVALGATIQGMVGFGMNLIALPLLLAIDERLIPAPLLFAHLVLVVCLTSVDFRRLDRAIFVPATIGAIPGTAIGLMTISLLSRDAFVVFTLVVLVLGIVLTMKQVVWPRTPVVCAIVGAVCGITGTTTSINGPPLGMLMAGASSLATIRSTLSAFLLLSSVFSLVALYAGGRFRADTMTLAAALIPGTIAGLMLSKRLLRVYGNRLAPRPTLLVTSGIATSIFVVKELWTRL